MHTDRHAGQVIADRLDHLNKTQTWLATECRVSNNAVTKWVKTGAMARRNAARVADVLGLSLYELWAAEWGKPPEGAAKVVYRASADAGPALCWLYDHELVILTAYRSASPEGRAMIDMACRHAPKELTPQ